MLLQADPCLLHWLWKSRDKFSSLPWCASRQLLWLHRTAVLRHDDYGQETLLNLLLRNYLHYSLYDQVRSRGPLLCP